MLGVVLPVVVGRRGPPSNPPCTVFLGVKRENLVPKWVCKGKTLSQNGCEKGKLSFIMGEL